MTDSEDAREEFEEYMKIRRHEIVTFEPKGFRDVYWCPYLNEPVIVEYRRPSPNKFCVNCSGDIDHPGVPPFYSKHTFICNVGKP